MTGKIGYGTVSEALAYKLPFIFVRRDYFNEEPFLRNMLEVLCQTLFSGSIYSLKLGDLDSELLNVEISPLQCYQSGVEMIRRDLLTGRWKPYLERALSLNPCYEGGTNGGEVLQLKLECYKYVSYQNIQHKVESAHKAPLCLE